MSAVVTDMRDFVVAIERQVPRGLHPCTDVAIGEYLAEMRAHVDDPAAVHDLPAKFVGVWCRSSNLLPRILKVPAIIATPIALAVRR